MRLDDLFDRRGGRRHKAMTERRADVFRAADADTRREIIADVLERTADWLERPGHWVQHTFGSRKRACALGALRLELGQSTSNLGERLYFDGGLNQAVERELKVCVQRFTGTESMTVVDWNDAFSQTQEAVVEGFRKCAARVRAGTNTEADNALIEEAMAGVEASTPHG